MAEVEAMEVWCVGEWWRWRREWRSGEGEERRKEEVRLAASDGWKRRLREKEREDSSGEGLGLYVQRLAAETVME